MRVSDEDLPTIDGFFVLRDVAFFGLLLEPVGGDLTELGVLYGRSAALIKSYLAPGEVFTIADLWEAPPGDGANPPENTSSHPGLTRAAFEGNYRLLHRGLLPVIVQAESSPIADAARHGMDGFGPIDESPLYDHVVLDIEAARTLLKPDGIVVFDDFRTAHAPGVAAAAWAAVVNDDLTPFALTDMKMYATWGAAAPHLERVVFWAADSEFDFAVDSVAGHDVARLTERPEPPPRYVRPERYVPEVLRPAFAAARKHLGRSRRA